MSAAVPSAAGNLESTTLAQVLLYALERQLTGTLVLETADQKRSAISLVNGAPVKAKSAEPVIHLGRLLMELGMVDEPTINRTLVKVADQRRLHGQVLLDEQKIDHLALDLALREQLMRKIVWMFTLPSTTMYGYYDRVDYLERWGGAATPVEPLALIWRGVRGYANASRIATTLAAFEGAPIRMHPEAQPARFRFDPSEQAIVDVLRARPQTLKQIVSSGLEEAPKIRRIVYVLALARHLDVGALPLGIDGPLPELGTSNAPRRSSQASYDSLTARQIRDSIQPRMTTPPRISYPPSERASPTPPPATAPPTTPPHSKVPSSPPRSRASSSPPHSKVPSSPPHSKVPSSPPRSRASSSPPRSEAAVEAFKGEIRERASQLGKTYYEILGISPDDPTSVVQAAFFRLAKRWHPDRLGAEFSDVKETATRVFARMSEAHAVLTDPQRRKEYDEIMKAGGGAADEQAEVQAVLRATTNFQKAEVLLKKNALAAAEQHARLAVEDDPKQADYIALLAWIQSQRPDRQGTPLDDLIETLNNAVHMEQNNLRVRWYRGQLLKRAGKDPQAMRDFRFIVDNDPQHLDATRELRLYGMRRAARPSQAPPARRSTDRRPAVKEPGLLGKFFKR